MELQAPRYFEKFKCIADKCCHNCCVGWEIDIDEEAKARYAQTAGEIGSLIRAGIVSDEDGAHFALCSDGHCALLDDRGLCRIITALGEGALCEICREHPRFYNVVGDRMECGLGAACEEAARLILGEADYGALVHVGEAEASLSAPAEIDTVAVRRAIYAILSDPTLPYEERLAVIAEKYEVPALPSEAALRALFATLEYLDEAHRAMFEAISLDVHPRGEAAVLCERFFAYLVHRHVAPARTARELCLALGLAFVLERLFRYLLCVCALSSVVSAGIVSEELEYSEDNTDAVRFELEMSSL